MLNSKRWALISEFFFLNRYQKFDFSPLTLTNLAAREYYRSSGWLMFPIKLVSCTCEVAAPFMPRFIHAQFTRFKAVRYIPRKKRSCKAANHYQVKQESGNSVHSVMRTDCTIKSFLLAYQ
jgi:hypothetical protein